MQKVKREYLSLQGGEYDWEEIVRLEKTHYPDDEIADVRMRIVGRASRVSRVFLSPDKARELAAGLTQFADELDHQAKKKKARNNKITVKEPEAAVAIES